VSAIVNLEPVAVIAEIGVNHNGFLAVAQQLVREVAAAGADYAKFQTFRAGELASPGAKLAKYQTTNSNFESQFALLKSLELTDSDFLTLQKTCEDNGVGFLSTAHDFESAEFLFGLRLDYIKVPSGDLTNVRFLELVATQLAPVLLSTGMATMAEVQMALQVLESGGLPRDMVTVLQCTTNYPAPVDEANLRAMVTMGAELGVSIGYSDHTIGVDASLAAVALGASVIEKHVTLDRKMPGPDHAASIESKEFRALVRSIRLVESALGSPQKGPTASEEAQRAVVRKSIMASRQILAGERFTEENVTLKRPGTGISAARWHEVLGTIARRDYHPDDMVEM
jgi:N,N'-diacetyllegionaminate synthase